MIDGTHIRCLRACYDQVRLLDLTVPPERIYLRKLLLDRNLELPAIVVSLPPNSQETFEPATNMEDDIGYPVLVSFLAASNQDLEVDDRLTTDREVVLSKFRFQGIMGVTDMVYFCRPEPFPVIDMSLFQQANLDVGGFILRFISRQTRG